MASIRREVSIDVSPDTLWDALKDVGALHTRLVTGFVTDCRLEGNARIVTFANGIVAKELIVAVDDAGRRLAWSAVGNRLTHHNASAQVFAEGQSRQPAGLDRGSPARRDGSDDSRHDRRGNGRDEADHGARLGGAGMRSISVDAVAAGTDQGGCAVEWTGRLISSGSEFEERIGYSRALVAGDWVFVSGTTGFDYATMSIPEDVVEQARQCLANIEQALHQAGASLRDVVRVTYVLPEVADFEPCWPVLRQHFGEVRPAAMMISAGLADPRMKIEIEVTALKRS